MCSRRRTLSLVLTFLSLNNGPVFVSSSTLGRGINAKLALTEYSPPSEPPSPHLVNSLLTVGSANRALPVAQNVFPERFGFYPQKSINTVSTSNYAVPNHNSVTKYSSPLEALSQPFPNTLGFPSQMESVSVIDQNYSPVTQTVQVEGFAPSVSGREVYQTPISVQVPSMPQLSPFSVFSRPRMLPSQSGVQDIYSPNIVSEMYTPNANVVSDIYTPHIVSEMYTPNANIVSDIYSPHIVSEIHTQNANVVSDIYSPNIVSEIYTPNVVSEIYTSNVVSEINPQSIDTEITTITEVPVETTNLAISTADMGCYGQPLPISLQINMASPCVPQPLIAVLSPSPQTPSSPFDYPSSGIPPYPIIVMEKTRSKLKSLLPILLISLFDGGSRNGGGGGGCCSQCGPSTPIPFPIVIPTCNPIICGGSRSSRGKKKGKTSTDEDTEA